jgi:RNA polymerase sigma-70 factor (ECF subfamily)
MPTAAELQEEEQRLKEAQADVEAFRWFYDRYFAQIMALVYGLVHDREDASEVTARVFCRALMSLRRYQWRGRPYGAYLHRIALNETVSYWRSERLRCHAHLEAIAPVAGTRRDALSELIWAEEEARVLDAISKLKLSDQTVLSMYYWEGLNTAEIASALRQPQGSVQARLKRARDKLEPTLAGEKQPAGAAKTAPVAASPLRWLGIALQRRLRPDRHPG